MDETGSVRLRDQSIYPVHLFIRVHLCSSVV